MATKHSAAGSASARRRTAGPAAVHSGKRSPRTAAGARTVTQVASDDGSTVVTRSVLPGGLRVVSERMSAVRSVALGVWVGVGSVDEPESLAGATHYLEHVLFKGTATRTAVDISAAFDAVGGELNAFTGKEFTCYYARVLDDDLPLAVDILGDIVSQPLLASADIEAEREVIAEELAMATDDPGDAVHELFAAALFDGHPLARPILGSSQSVADLSRRQVAGWFKRRYRLPTMVVSAAGNIDHARLVRLVRKAFAGRIAAADAARPDEARTPSSAARRLRRADPSVGADSRLVSRRTEQTHIVVGLPSLPRHDPRRMAVSVVNAALGGGMSSRLFCDIRENRSLAYSVFSYTTAYADAGALAMYAGCLPSKAGQVLDRLRAAATEVAEHGLGEDEVERAKGALRGSLVLGLEEPGSRMSRLGKAELVYPTFKSTDELLAMIDAVTVEQANEVAAQILGVEPTVAVVGPFKSMRALRAGSVGRTR